MLLHPTRGGTAVYLSSSTYFRYVGTFIFQDEVKGMMTKEEFIKQKEQGKTFLVIVEEEGDSITPISLYRRMKGRRNFY